MQIEQLSTAVKEKGPSTLKNKLDAFAKEKIAHKQLQVEYQKLEIRNKELERVEYAPWKNKKARIRKNKPPKNA